MKTNKGITLVALIITIIVMLILAGVIIVSAVADGGVIDRAQAGLKINEAGTVQEIIETSYTFEVDPSSSGSAQYLDIEKTAVAAYKNLTANNYSLLDTNGVEMQKEGLTEEQIIEALVINDEVKLNVIGKHGEYTGTISKNGLVEDIKIIDPEAKGIELSHETLTLKPGETEKVTAKLNGAMGNISYSSNDDTIATIDSEGNVAAIANGTTTITATWGEYTATCNVIVAEGITSISISGPSSVKMGQESDYFTALDQNGNELYPSEIEWSCSSGATIEQSSYCVSIIPTYTGSTMQIRATSIADSSVYDVKYITVTPNGPTSITIDSNTHSGNIMQAGETYEAIAYDQNGDLLYSDDILWSCGTSTVNLTTHSSYASFTPTAAGRIAITATSRTDSSVYSTYYVTVNPNGPTSISIKGVSSSGGEMKVGEKMQLSAIDQNGNLLYADDITWSCSSGATITSGSSEAWVTATTVSSVSVKATSKSNSSIYAVCYIRVYPGITSISISDNTNSSGTINVGETLELYAFDQNGDTLSSNSITWSCTSGYTIHQGTNYAYIVPSTAGRITITATSRTDSSVYSTCSITVNPNGPTSISVYGNSSGLEVGVPTELYAEDEDGNTLTSSDVTWSCTEGATISTGSTYVTVTPTRTGEIPIKVTSNYDSSVYGMKYLYVYE